MHERQRAEETVNEWCTRFAAVVAERDRLRDAVHRPRCAYCSFGEDADFSHADLVQHIERECDVHPIKRLKKALTDIRGLLVVRPHRFADQTEQIHAVIDAALAPAREPGDPT